MDSTQLQKNIESSLSKLMEQLRSLSASSSSVSPDTMQEFISGIRMLYEKAMDLQHQNAIQMMGELEAAIAAKYEAIPPPARVQPIHVESFLPKSPAILPEIKEAIQEVLQVVEQNASPKPVSIHPSMDELLLAAANKAAETKQVEESSRRKKVITDIHDKFDEVPTFAGKFNDHETLAQRMAGTKLQSGVAERHQRKPISDLRVAIGTNEKFLFINQLFLGDSQSYSISIESLNNSGSLDAARNFVHQNLLSKYDWDLSTHPANLFLDLVERRFIS